MGVSFVAIKSHFPHNRLYYIKMIFTMSVGTLLYMQNFLLDIDIPL